MRTGRKNNQGFSLVEVIVVIAIMAIIVGITGMSVSSLSSRKVKKCADEIVSTLERTKVLALGKEQGQVEFLLNQDSDGNFHAMIYQGSDPASDPILDRTIGKSPITITVEFSDGTRALLDNITGNTPHAIHGTGTNGLRLVFNRSTGAFEQNTSAVGSNIKQYCSKIIVNGNGHTVEITTVGATGKIRKEIK